MTSGDLVICKDDTGKETAYIAYDKKLVFYIGWKGTRLIPLKFLQATTKVSIYTFKEPVHYNSKKRLSDYIISLINQDVKINFLNRLNGIKIIYNIYKDVLKTELLTNEGRILSISSLAQSELLEERSQNGPEDY